MDQGHDVRAPRGRRARAAEDITVAGRIDDHPAHDRLPAGLGFRDHPSYGAVLDEGPRAPRVKTQVDAGFQRHLLRGLLPAFGVEGRGVDDRLRFLPRVELLEPPPDPAVPDVGIVPEAIVHRRRHAGADPLHPVDDLQRQASHRDLSLGAHVVEHQDHAA